MTTETAMEVENKENGTDKITSDMEGMEVGENGHNGIEETPEDDDSKYTDEDKPRRVVVKNIDFKANAEEIEEFFGSETFQNIEHVSRKFTARGTWKEKKEGKPLKKRFNGVVIVTFEDKDAAEKFIAMEDLTFKERKLRKHSLTESEERREKFLEQKKAKIEANKKKKEDEKKAAQLKKKKDEEAAQKKKTEESVKKNAKSTNPGDCIVVCRGFHMNADSLQEVMKYFYDNHEHVIDVNMEVLRDNFGYQRWDDKAFVTFMNKGAADRFISLAYVRFKGNKITRLVDIYICSSILSTIIFVDAQYPTTKTFKLERERRRLRVLLLVTRGNFQKMKRSLLSWKREQLSSSKESKTSTPK